jgi:hypothetical protein
MGCIESTAHRFRQWSAGGRHNNGITHFRYSLLLWKPYDSYLAIYADKAAIGKEGFAFLKIWFEVKIELN